ncbi:MAG: hypothetical protein ACKPJ9_19905, partial [Dolichospermum sp.]
MLDDNQIREVYETLKSEHKTHLEHHSVTLPPLYKNGAEYNLRGLQLVYLRHHLGALVHRDDLSNFVRSIVAEASADQQPRHLKYMGWDIRLSGKSGDKWLDGKPLPNGFNGLAQVQTPSPDYAKTIAKRVGRANATDWVSLCQAYDNACAMCGKRGVKLEKGHKNPALPDTISNLLPMCGPCNNWVNNDVIID